MKKITKKERESFAQEAMRLHEEQLDKELTIEATDPMHVSKAGRKPRVDRTSIRNHPFQVLLTHDEWLRVNNDAFDAGYGAVADYIRAKLFGGKK